MRKRILLIILIAEIAFSALEISGVIDICPILGGNLESGLIALLITLLLLISIYWQKSLDRAVKIMTVKLETDARLLKKVQFELIKSERTFRLMFEYAPIGIAMRDNTDKLTDINQAYADILGYTREELLSGEFEKVGYPEDFPKSEAEYNKLIAGANSALINKRLIKKDGSIAYVTQSIVLIRDTDDKPAFLLGMTIDNTEQKKALTELIENEQFYRSVVRDISGIVYNCAMDDDWTMYYISDGILNMSGYPASDFNGNTIRSYTSIIHPEDRKAVNEVVQRGIEQNSPYTIEYRILHKDGSVIWVFEEGRGIYNGQGEFQHLSGTIINVTEHKAAELELQKYREHLEEMVSERTKELQDKTQKLEEFNKLFVGREYRIKELRDQVKNLKQKLSVN